MKPDFLFIGFSKCETTTSYEIFKQHKKICFSDIKEPWYYVDSKINKKGFQWYQENYYGNITNNMLNKDKEFIIGEINSDLASKYNARILSLFKMNLVKGFNFKKEEENIVENISESFDQFVREAVLNKNHISKINLSSGNYYNQIKDYMKFFDEKK